jgi:signal transduction histidine kinase
VKYTDRNVKKLIIQNFNFASNEFRIKLEVRLSAHAQLLRSGAAFFAASDTITQEEWKKYVENGKISKNLPGIQGLGYSHIISESHLEQHINFMRNLGFTGYNVTPVGERDIYTSIIYLEPFSGRNLRAFGYDMFSEPVRRKAMELSRDSDYAMLSGKVMLVQETEEDVQAGVLMYVPVYSNGMPSSTLAERRHAIRGWVYSPYRMNDLIIGILGDQDLQDNRSLHLKIYDGDIISDSSLLFDSQSPDQASDIKVPNLEMTLPVVFNGKKWTLKSMARDESLNLFRGETFRVLLWGIVISLLLFALSMAIVNTTLRSKQIQKLNDELTKNNYDKDRFISILGHDLRSPFNALIGLSEIVIEETRKLEIDEIRNHVIQINQVSHKTLNLLDDILIWVRTQSGKINYEPEILKLSDVVNSVLETFIPVAGTKNIKINQNISEQVLVSADIDMLKTIMRNLISNAVKFTNKTGTINISSERNGPSAIIVVADNGKGIRPDDLNKLFDISQVFTTQGTEGETGSGLGLLLCREFVEKHGGKIWVESEPGRGSTFKFTLPLSFL